MKNFLIFILLLFATHSVFAANIDRTTGTTCTRPQVNELFMKNHAHRAITYNVINLTSEQSERKGILDKNRYEELQPYFEQLDREVFILRKLKTGKASDSSINSQKRLVKKIRKQIEKIDKKYDKEFEKCLTREQRAKYHEVKRLERRDIMHKINDYDNKYYDKNMPIFGQE